MRIRSKLLLDKEYVGSSTSATEQEKGDSPPISKKADSYVTTITGTTDLHVDHYADHNVEEESEVEVSRRTVG